MKRLVYVVTKPGSLKRLRLAGQHLQAPGPGQVVVAVKSIGLNYADIFAIMGLYSATPQGPFVPGLEFAGEIVDTGPGTGEFRAGDKVMGVTRFGAYTTLLSIDYHYIVKLPEGWSYDEGAAFPVQVLTAYYALVHLGNLQKEQTVLIHSAAGGVGLLANRIAMKYNAYTIGVVGDSSKLELLQKEGYNKGIVRSGNFREDLKAALKGRELNLVLETTGGKYLQWSYDALASQGRLVAYGSAQYTPGGDKPFYPRLVVKYLFRPRLDPLKMITDNKSVMAFNLIWLYEKSELMHTLMNEISQLRLAPPYIGRKFSFEQLPEALRIFRSGKTVGKLIVSTDL